MADHHLDHLLDLGVLYWLRRDYTNVVITLIAAYLWKFLLMCLFALITDHRRRLVRQSHDTPSTILQRFGRGILFRALIVVLLAASTAIATMSTCLVTVLARAATGRGRLVF